MKNIHVRIVVFTVVILSLLYVIFNWTMASIIHSKKDVVVPDVQGKSIYEALSVLSEKSMSLKLDSEEFDRTLPPGIILRQNPLPGMRVKEGKTVKIIISQGGESSFVPDLIGQKSRSAALIIRSYGLILGEESSRYSVVYDKDVVIGQDPPAGTGVAKDTMVNILVSQGPPPPAIRLMPKFIGKNINDAVSWAENNNLELDITKENVSNAVMDSVIAQYPEPDTDLEAVQQISVKIVGVPEILPQQEQPEQVAQ